MTKEMTKYARYCPKCEEENREFWAVYNYDPDRQSCFWHNTPLIETKLTYPEYNVLRAISEDPDFWKAMRKLKEDDIIEYELKMSQFRAQVGDGESDFVSNQVTCPYCHSVNVRKLSTTGRMVSTGFFGLGSSKVGKQFHCNGCGADF